MGQLASTLPSEQATNAGKQDASWASSVKFCEYELLARNISGKAMRGCQSIAALVDRAALTKCKREAKPHCKLQGVDHGFLRLVWCLGVKICSQVKCFTRAPVSRCMWAGYLDLAARLARSGSKALGFTPPTGAV